MTKRNRQYCKSLQARQAVTIDGHDTIDRWTTAGQPLLEIEEFAYICMSVPSLKTRPAPSPLLFAGAERDLCGTVRERRFHGAPCGRRRRGDGDHERGWAEQRRIYVQRPHPPRARRKQQSRPRLRTSYLLLWDEKDIRTEELGVFLHGTMLYFQTLFFVRKSEERDHARAQTTALRDDRCIIAVAAG